MSTKLCTAQLMGVKYDRVSVYNVQITLHGEGYIENDFFRKALNLVQKRHFYLNSYISNSQVQEFIPFINDISIPIENVEVDNLDDWKENAEEELNRRFINGCEPFARVKVLKKENEYKIILTLPHFISDGMSITCLVKDIFKVYSELIKGKEILRLDEIPYMSISNDMFPSEIDLDYSIILSGDESNEIENNPIPLDRRKTKFYELKFSEDDTKQIIERCRHEETTVYAALCSSTMSTMADEIRIKYKELNGVNVSCVSVVDHRHLTREPIMKEQLGLGALVARTNRVLLEENSLLWDIARNGRSCLKNFISKHGFFKVLQFIRQYLSLPDEIFQRKMEFNDAHVVVSYLGKLEKIGDAEYFGNMKVNEVSYATTLQYLQGNEWGIFLCAHIFKNCLTLNLNYIDAYWDEERIIRFGNRLKETIKDMMDRDIES